MAGCALFKPVSIDTEEAYIKAIKRHVEKAWHRPEVRSKALHCVLRVKQSPEGVVLQVVIAQCNGGEAERAALLESVKQASPLPVPDNTDLFESILQLVFDPKSK